VKSKLLSPGYESVRVSDRVLAFISSESNSDVVTGNSVAIAGDRSVLVVDSGHLPTLARNQISEIRSAFGGPVRYLVNTHWHPDHWVGNGVYDQEYPGIAILSHVFTRSMMEPRYSEYPGRLKEAIPGMVAMMKEEASNGKRVDGSSLTEEDVAQRTDSAIPDLEMVMGEADLMKIAFPNLTFEHQVNIDLGGVIAKVMHLGRGNTGGDVVVHVPDEAVLITGDLVVTPTPYSFGSYLREWVETLKKLRATGATVIVPGHGPVMRDWDYVDTLMELLRSVSQQVKEELQRSGGKSPTPSEILAKIDLSSFKSKLAGNSYFHKLAFDQAFAQPAVERAYLEEKFGLE
jgi:glyoxylase-like metal-dependent hydrolase (beta-lactamase superfamily II)